MAWVLGGAWDVALAQGSTNAPSPKREGGGRRQDPFERYDKDGDGRVTPQELNNPAMFQWLDRDADGSITRQEATEALTEFGAGRRWARPAKSSGTKATDEGAATGAAKGAKADDDVKEALVPVPARELGVGRWLRAGSWKALDGRRVDLDARPAGKGRVIVATSSSCPLSRKYAPVLGRLSSEWAGRGFEFVHVAAVDSDPEADVRKMASDAGWKSPTLRDATGALARTLGLRTTTEAIVTDAAGTVVYRGAVDDQHGLGYSRAEAREHPLTRALESVERGERPVLAATTAPGCDLDGGGPIPVAMGSEVTFHNRVSRILQTHCVECHHAGGPGPFELETYASVSGHARMMAKQVEKGIMPPWFAAPDKDSSHTPWINDRSLPEADRRDLLAWLSGPRPEGNPKDAPLPLRHPGEWLIGTPDAVYALPKSFSIPAEGVMPYQKATVETALSEDKWVTAVEIRPTAKAAVHHVLVFARPPGQRGRGSGDDSGDGTIGFFAAYVPGNTFQIYPEGFAKPLPAGTRLRFQIHYTPYGTATNDQMQIAFKFAPKAPRHRIHVVGIANPMLRIPAGAPNHPESASLPVPREARVLALMPHMHVRGKAFRFEWINPDGVSKTLLDVPRYDFNWQLSYRMARPLEIPSGSRLRATAWYDNSANNPANPDPSREVRWGEQTYEEMMLGYVEYYFPDEGI
ncbi:MAG: redoxin family protein [Verrucomicrobiota bacterium]